MELKNISQIQDCIRNGVKLYLIYPTLNSNGIIRYNKPMEIVNCVNYTYNFYITTRRPFRQISLLNKRIISENTEIKPTDEINTRARVFTTIDDAQKALESELGSLSYTAIKYVDYTLKKIKAQREKLDEKQAKYDALRKSYYEISSKRFSK